MNTLDLVLIGDIGEQPVAMAAARQLAKAVSAAWGREWAPDLSVGATLPAGAVGLASLASEVASDRPLSEIAAEWNARCAQHPRLLLPTLYRHVDEPRRIERIRRLNLIAVELSQAHGVEIADVDQAFALIGAARLGSDYRCATPRAVEAAGHVIAQALLSMDLGDALPPDIQQAARETLGGLRDLILREIGSST